MLLAMLRDACRVRLLVLGERGGEEREEERRIAISHFASSVSDPGLQSSREHFAERQDGVSSCARAALQKAKERRERGRLPLAEVDEVWVDLHEVERVWHSVFSGNEAESPEERRSSSMSTTHAEKRWREGDDHRA